MTRRVPILVLIAYAVLAAATAFFPVLLGQLPVPTDCALRLLPGETAPAHGGNDERWDVPTQYLPWTKAVSDAYRGGRFPLRFSANGCGNPLWANPQAQALTPTTWITWPLPEAWALAAAAALRLWLAAAGAFWFLRRRGISPAAAAAGGLAYGFSLAFTAWLHYPLTYPQALFPWLALALERLADGRAGGFAAATATIAALLLGGYPEGELFAAAAALAYFTAVVIRRKAPMARRFSLLAASALLALGLTAVVWIPQVRAILASDRSTQIARASLAKAAAPDPSQILRLPIYSDLLRYWIVPEAKGNPRDGDKFGLYSFAGRVTGYPGILVLALGLAAFAWRRAPPAVVLSRIALVVLTLYILWYPPLRWALEATPGVRQLAQRLTTSRAAFLTVFLLALLAAFQLDRLRRGPGRRATLVSAALVLLAVGVVFAEFLRDPARPPLTPWRAVSFLLPASLLGATLGIVRAPLTPARMRFLIVLFLAGTAADLLRIGIRFNPGTPPDLYFPRSPQVQALQAASRGGRFATNSSYLSGMAEMYGLEDVGMQDPMTPARYLDVLRAATGYEAPERPLGNVRRLDAPLLDFLNARARLDGETVRAAAAPDGILPEQLIGCSDEADLLRRLAAEPEFLRAALVVGANETFRGSAEILGLERPAPERIHLRVRSDAPRVLVLPESDDGGWSAETQGQPLSTFLANGAFLAIRIPAGETRIVCRYLPPGFREGLAASALSAIVAGVLIVRRGVRGARPTRTSARSSGRSSAGAAAAPGPRGRGPRARPSRPDGAG